MESNAFLRVLGFQIVEMESHRKIKPELSWMKRKIASPKGHHGERCPKCKETIRSLLERLFGEVRQNYKFEVGTRPEDFLNTFQARGQALTNNSIFFISCK